MGNIRWCMLPLPKVERLECTEGCMYVIVLACDMIAKNLCVCVCMCVFITSNQLFFKSLKHNSVRFFLLNKL